MISYDKLYIQTGKNVYKPSDDTFLAADVILDCLKKFRKSNISVLDLGAGTGLLGLIAGQNAKVKKVIFADINPFALDLSKKNLELNKSYIQAECSFVKSNLFSNIKEKFDLIIFNAPYLPAEIEKGGIITKAWVGGKEGIEISVKFLKGVKKHLTKGGRVILIASTLSNVRKLDRIIKKDFRIEDTYKKQFFFEEIVAYKLSIKS